MLNDSNNCRVLVVDDNTYLLAVIAEILGKGGITCKTLDDPQHIFDVISEFSPDVLLLDVSMPHIDGRELCRQLKNNSLHAYIPVILISGFPMDAESIADAGADNFIGKPFENEELIDIINQYSSRVEKVNLAEI